MRFKSSLKPLRLFFVLYGSVVPNVSPVLRWCSVVVPGVFCWCSVVPPLFRGVPPVFRVPLFSIPAFLVSWYALWRRSFLTYKSLVYSYLLCRQRTSPTFFRKPLNGCSVLVDTYVEIEPFKLKLLFFIFLKIFNGGGSVTSI